MQPESRAVVFDLDDTLYPYRRFRVSGFAAAAAWLEARVGLDRRLGFRALFGHSRGAWAGHEVQACLAQYDLPLALAPEMIDVLRHHEPRLRLAPVVRRMLQTLRADGWRIGVLTNGMPSIQAKKIDALGLRTLVDEVVYASEHGSGGGKPDPETFAEVVARLGVTTDRVVVVGNDEVADIGGALVSGLSSVRCDVWLRQPRPTQARVVAHRVREIPSLICRVLEEEVSRHAA
jgi:putative hydrolase of the HAD superfamily